MNHKILNFVIILALCLFISPKDANSYVRGTVNQVQVGSSIEQCDDCPCATSASGKSCTVNAECSPKEECTGGVCVLLPCPLNKPFLAEVNSPTTFVVPDIGLILGWNWEGICSYLGPYAEECLILVECVQNDNDCPIFNCLNAIANGDPDVIKTCATMCVYDPKHIICRAMSCIEYPSLACCQVTELKTIIDDNTDPSVCGPVAACVQLFAAIAGTTNPGPLLPPNIGYPWCYPTASTGPLDGNGCYSQGAPLVTTEKCCSLFPAGDILCSGAAQCILTFIETGTMRVECCDAMVDVAPLLGADPETLETMTAVCDSVECYFAWDKQGEKGVPMNKRSIPAKCCNILDLLPDLPQEVDQLCTAAVTCYNDYTLDQAEQLANMGAGIFPTDPLPCCRALSLAERVNATCQPNNYVGVGAAAAKSCEFRVNLSPACCDIADSIIDDPIERQRIKDGCNALLLADQCITQFNQTERVDDRCCDALAIFPATAATQLGTYCETAGICYNAVRDYLQYQGAPVVCSGPTADADCALINAGFCDIPADLTVGQCSGPPIATGCCGMLTLMPPTDVQRVFNLTPQQLSNACAGIATCLAGFLQAEPEMSVTCCNLLETALIANGGNGANVEGVPAADIRKACEGAIACTANYERAVANNDENVVTDACCNLFYLLPPAQRPPGIIEACASIVTCMNNWKQTGAPSAVCCNTLSTTNRQAYPQAVQQAIAAIELETGPIDTLCATSFACYNDYVTDQATQIEDMSEQEPGCCRDYDPAIPPCSGTITTNCCTPDTTETVTQDCVLNTNVPIGCCNIMSKVPNVTPEMVAVCRVAINLYDCVENYNLTQELDPQCCSVIKSIPGDTTQLAIACGVGTSAIKCINQYMNDGIVSKSCCNAIKQTKKAPPELLKVCQSATACYNQYIKDKAKYDPLKAQYDIDYSDWEDDMEDWQDYIDDNGFPPGPQPVEPDAPMFPLLTQSCCGVVAGMDATAAEKAELENQCNTLLAGIDCTIALFSGTDQEKAQCCNMVQDNPAIKDACFVFFGCFATPPQKKCCDLFNKGPIKKIMTCRVGACKWGKQPVTDICYCKDGSTIPGVGSTAGGNPKGECGV